MAGRPERRSLLANRSPLDAPSVPQAEDEPQAATVALHAVPAAPEDLPAVAATETVAPAAPEPAPAKVAPVTVPASAAAEVPKKKQSFYQLPAETDQMRGAFRTTAHSEGFESLSDFIAKAVAEKVERLQNQYNGGRPFESFGANQIPKGRPLSS
jgi:hypothetical protein